MGIWNQEFGIRVLVESSAAGLADGTLKVIERWGKLMKCEMLLFFENKISNKFPGAI
ncbi:MAG: hypothetical protein JWQ27_433 [Ferruginibacter sp.]|nr:hypothetical protein [Ferruginibacter sp.]